MYKLLQTLKDNKETIKTVAITALATALLAFMLGMKFESRTNKQIEQARRESKQQIERIK